MPRPVHRRMLNIDVELDGDPLRVNGRLVDARPADLRRHLAGTDEAG